MKQVLLLENRIQHYAWGAPTAISRLLGRRPSGEPEAELWIGAHPRCPSIARWPSSAEDADGTMPLDALIARHPEEILGRRVAARFGPALPFLTKVLAAARPLSIQAHPSAHQAQKGYARENAAAVPLDAPQRNYRDENHKPELIVALTDFWALKGFRPIDEIVKALDTIGKDRIAGPLDRLRRTPDAGALRDFVAAILTDDETGRGDLVANVVDAARQRSEVAPHWARIVTLNDLYPGDVGVVIALLLNLVHLRPGEGLYLPAGELHAYLDGTGIEVMASSDNVLRGGLTAKHVDTAEMLAALTFDAGRAAVLAPRERSPTERVYTTPAEEFELSEIRVTADSAWSATGDRSVEILLCVEGEGRLTGGDPSETLPVTRGVSLLVPAAAGAYRIEGAARIFRTTVRG